MTQPFNLVASFLSPFSFQIQTISQVLYCRHAATIINNFFILKIKINEYKAGVNISSYYFFPRVRMITYVLLIMGGGGA
jgi:hypothetical protein